MLVIFSYFVSLTPNQTTNIISIIIILISTYTILIIVFIFSNIKTLSPPIYHTQANIFYLQSNTPSLIILVLIFLLKIIFIIKLTINTKGPLRPFKYV